MQTQPSTWRITTLAAMSLSITFFIGCGPTLVPRVTTAQCGNAVIEGDEQCDGDALRGFTCQTLGFSAGTMRCSPSCQLDTSSCTVANPLMNFCGNGLLDAGELCDGNKFGGLTCESYNFVGGQLLCSSDCKTVERQLCKTPPPSQQQVCGDGQITGSEVCDGAAHGGAECATLGHAGGVLSCAANCLNFNESQCTDSVCGNSVKDSSELCDGADLGDSSCKSLGFKSGSLSCKSDCKSWDFSACSNGSPAFCGNNSVEGGETCDGNDVGGKTCADFGFASGTLTCNSTCSALQTTACQASATATVASMLGTAGEITVQDALYLPASGDVVIAGSSWQNSSQMAGLILAKDEGYLARVNPVTKKTVWAKKLGNHAVAMAINNHGDIYVSTYSFDGYGATLSVYDDSGTLMEERTFEPLTATSDVRINAIVPVNSTSFLQAGVVIVGKYYGDVDFDGTERTNADSNHRAFVSRVGFPSSEWFTSVGTAFGAAGLETVAISGTHVVAGGYYTGQLLNCTSRGGKDLLVARFNMTTGGTLPNDCHGGPGDDVVTAIHVQSNGLHVAGTHGSGLRIYDDQFSNSTYEQINSAGQFVYRSSDLSGFVYWSAKLSSQGDKVRLSKADGSQSGQSAYLCHSIGPNEIAVQKIGTTGISNVANASGQEISCEALLNTGQSLMAYGNYESWASVGGFTLPQPYLGYEWQIK